MVNEDSMVVVEENSGARASRSSSTESAAQTPDVVAAEGGGQDEDEVADAAVYITADGTHTVGAANGKCGRCTRTTGTSRPAAAVLSTSNIGSSPRFVVLVVLTYSVL